MRTLLLGCCIAATAWTQPAEAGFIDSIKNMIWQEEAPAPTIRVLVLHDQPGALMEVKGKYHLYDPNTEKHLTTRLIGKRQYLSAQGHGIKWGEEFPDVHQIMIVPDADDTLTYIDGKPYAGKLFVYDIGGAISIVNELTIEDYISSILTPTFHDDMPKEALAAVAIAARTQALHAARNPKNRFWAVDARKSGFEGAGTIKTDSAVQAAVNTTHNMVLSSTGSYEGLTPFPAQWGSMTGGKAKNDEAVFSRISLFDVEAMAQRGNNAAQILSKAFPGSMIMIVR